MTITDAIHAYNVGMLIGFTDQQLDELSSLLNKKIVSLNQVIRSESVAPALRADLRKYDAILNEVSMLQVKRMQVNRNNEGNRLKTKRLISSVILERLVYVYPEQAVTII